MAADNASTPRILSWDDILAAPDTPEEVIEVPEWKGAVRVRGLTKAQQVDIRERGTINGQVSEQHVQMYLWMEGVLEPKVEEHQFAQLWQKNAGAVDRVLKRVLELSGMAEDTVKKAEIQFRPAPGTKV